MIGPGLGRDPAILESVKSLIAEARREEKVMVIDADGLFLVTSEPNTVEGYSGVILTPNEAEFGRLYHKVVSNSNTSGIVCGQNMNLLCNLLRNL